jgi:DNA-binding LacI/PurR family transcriptional regulator
MPPDPAGSARPARRPTIADIARSAGVSKSAVSCALNGQQGISTATAERILAVANELGWRPNRAARSLRAASAGACGVVLAERPSVHPFGPYFSDLFLRTGMAAGGHSFTPELGDVDIYGATG